MSWFNRYYHCDDCQTDWQDEWSCVCNDRCPTCDAETVPHDHAEVDINSQDKAYQDMIMYSKGVTFMDHNLKLSSIPFILIIPKGDHGNEDYDLSNLRPIGDLSVLLSSSKSSDNPRADDSGYPWLYMCD